MNSESDGDSALHLVTCTQFPSIRPVPCQNRMTGESGVCTFNWSCINVAHGVHIGPCVDRFFVGTCCKIPDNSTAESRRSTTTATIASSSTYGGAQTTKEDSKLESLLEVADSTLRSTTEERLKIPIPTRDTSNDAIFQFHHDEIIKVSSSNPESNGDSYPQPETHNSFLNVGVPADASSSSLSRKPVLLGTLSTTTSSTKGNNFITTAQTSGRRQTTLAPDVAGVKQTTHLPVREEDVTINHHQEYNSPASESSHKQTVSSQDGNKQILFAHFYDKKNPIPFPESLHNFNPFLTSEIKSDLWTTPDGNIDSHEISIVLEDSIHHSPEIGHHANEDKISSNAFFTWAYNILSNGFKNTTYVGNNPASTQNKLNSSISSSPIIPDAFNPSHTSSSESQYIEYFPYHELKVSDSTMNEIDTSFTTSKSTSEQGTSVNIDSEFLNFTKFTGPEYPWPSPQPSTPSESTASTSDVTTSRDMSRVCGRSRSSMMARIVGGRKSHYLRWPWMISLRRYEGKTFKHKCGAALLNQLWAITAAHCVDGKLPNDVILRLGEYNFHRLDEFHPHVERRIYMIVIHPEFDPATYENDLALLRFYEPVKFQANIVPICLPKFTEDISGRTAVVTGWGRLAEEGDLPGSLHEVHMPILTNKECEEMYSQAGYPETIRDVFVCAGLMNGGLDACEGDSGGPMVLKGDKGQYTLVGLISWGMGCAVPRQPGVYTRITKFVDWIDEIIMY